MVCKFSPKKAQLKCNRKDPIWKTRSRTKTRSRKAQTEKSLFLCKFSRKCINWKSRLQSKRSKYKKLLIKSSKSYKNSIYWRNRLWKNLTLKRLWRASERNSLTLKRRNPRKSPSTETTRERTRTLTKIKTQAKGELTEATSLKCDKYYMDFIFWIFFMNLSLILFNEEDQKALKRLSVFSLTGNAQVQKDVSQGKRTGAYSYDCSRVQKP